MTYETPQALRTALEHRLRTRAEDSGINLDRLRRRVVFERVVSRLEAAEPGRWVLKGGMALEVRLGDDARLTKDLDLGLRDDIANADVLRDRLIETLAADPEGDGFLFAVGPPKRMAQDGGGHLTWRVAVNAELAGRTFGALKVDVSPRPHELEATETVSLPNSLAFAGITTPQVEIIDVHRHAAEKFHAILRDFGDRENSRVRDLVDLMLLDGNGLLARDQLAQAIAGVWSERDRSKPPGQLPALPVGWRAPYEHLAGEHDVHPASFPAAAARVATLWAETFATERS